MIFAVFDLLNGKEKEFGIFFLVQLNLTPLKRELNLTLAAYFHIFVSNANLSSSK